MLKLIQSLLQAHADALIGAIATIIPTIGTILYFVYKKLPFPKIPPSEKKKEQLSHEMLLEDGLRRYEQYVLSDPRIAQIHIIGMEHPLTLLDVYVQLYLNPHSTLPYTLNPLYSDSEETLEPEILLLADQQTLAHRVSESLKADDILRHYERCIIVGDPGIGKSTLLHYLALKAARKELANLHCTPVYIQLNTFDPEQHRHLLDVTLAQFDNFITLTDAHEHLQRKMQSGKILLLLDGLDETRIGLTDKYAENTYVALVKNIEQLAATYPLMPIIVAVRKAGYQQHSKVKGFHELEIMNFRASDSRTFVSNWFEAYPTGNKTDKIKDLNTRLERNLRIQSLASNPLLLSLIVIVYEGHLHLPERRADLYRKCIEVLQTQWDASRDIQRRREFPLIFQHQLLLEIAWHFHTQKKRYFPVDEIIQVIRRFLPTVDIPEDRCNLVLEQITLENGLLREQAHGWYGFSHLTFQEYFVMQYIIANQQEDCLLQQLHNSWWEEVLLLYIGSVADASPFLSNLLAQNVQNVQSGTRKKVANGPTPQPVQKRSGRGSTSQADKLLLQNDLFQNSLILAGRCLAEKPRVSNQALRSQIIDQLLRSLQTTPYTLARERIAHTLAGMNNPQVNDRMLILLATRDGVTLAVRESVGRALGDAGERSLAPELLALLLQKGLERFIRIVIARALGVLGETSIVNSLLSILEDNQEDPFVRQSIASTLGQLGERSVVPGLLRICQQTYEHALVLQSIALALEKLQDEQAVAVLSSMLQARHLDWYVRGTSARVISSLGARDDIPMFLELLEDEDENIYVRRCVALALGTFEQTDIFIDHLLNLLYYPTIDSSIRASIASSIASIGDRTVVPDLIQLFKDEQTHPKVRTSVALALGALADSKDAQTLNALNGFYQRADSDEYQDASIIIAMGMLEVRAVTHDLINLLSNAQLPQDMLPHIVQALSCLESHHNIDKYEIARALVDLLTEPNLDRYRGQCIIKVLCELREIAIIPSLCRLLSNQNIDRSIRQRIADSIAQLAQDEETETKLFALLTNTDISDDIYRALWIVSRHVKRA